MFQVMLTGICNCNCNFNMNVFLENVENSVSKILTEKEMVYHQRLVEMENRLRGVIAGIESCSALRAATPVSNLTTSGPISSASDHFLSVRSRMSVVSYQTEAKMIWCLGVLSKESGADDASKMSGMLL
jgi:hypothetical protein